MQQRAGTSPTLTSFSLWMCTFPGVPSGARSRNLLFHRQALCQLSYRHHGREEWGGRVSRVLFPMVISLGPTRDRPRRRLRGGSRLPASASNLLAADSEIAAGRIALFTPVNRYWSLLLSRGLPRANLDCRRAVSRAPPRLSPGTRALCSSDFPLAPKRQRPSLPTPYLGCQCAGFPASGRGSVERCCACSGGQRIRGAEGEI